MQWRRSPPTCSAATPRARTAVRYWCSLFCSALQHQGDSGGPLFFTHPASGRAEQIGVVSGVLAALVCTVAR